MSITNNNSDNLPPIVPDNISNPSFSEEKNNEFTLPSINNSISESTPINSDNSELDDLNDNQFIDTNDEEELPVSETIQEEKAVENNSQLSNTTLRSDTPESLSINTFSEDIEDLSLEEINTGNLNINNLTNQIVNAAIISATDNNSNLSENSNSVSSLRTNVNTISLPELSIVDTDTLNNLNLPSISNSSLSDNLLLNVNNSNFQTLMNRLNNNNSLGIRQINRNFLNNSLNTDIENKLLRKTNKTLKDLYPNLVFPENMGVVMCFLDTKKIVHLTYNEIIEKSRFLGLSEYNSFKEINLNFLIKCLYKKYLNCLLLPIYNGELIRINCPIFNFKKPILFLNKKVTMSASGNLSSNWTSNFINNLFYNNTNLTNLLPPTNNNLERDTPDLNITPQITTTNPISFAIPEPLETSTLEPEPILPSVTEINTLNTETNTETNTENNNDNQETLENNEEENEQSIENEVNEEGESNEDIVNFTSHISNLLNNFSNNISNDYGDKYEEQLEKMSSMGFSDREKALQALIVSDGDLETAINYYLN